MPYRIVHTGWMDNMQVGGGVDDASKYDIRDFLREPSIIGAAIETFEEARDLLKRNFVGENAEHIEPRFHIELDGWLELVLENDDGGKRHYLDGKPVHCGSGLELQRLERIERGDMGDYVSKPVDGGRVVRYEATSSPKRGLDVTLLADLDGHEFASGLEPWMRFRWPVRGR